RKTNIGQKQMHAYLKSLEVSNFKGFSAYFARMSPLGVYTYAFGFHSGNLTPFWTVSQRVDRFIDTLERLGFSPNAFYDFITLL
ncbi:MAG: hypothetical protein IJE70_02265, partial [Oscillospiraceae bacterium]|nr:hypothetical protein [Oscillospiraceae bacterium]